MATRFNYLPQKFNFSGYKFNFLAHGFNPLFSESLAITIKLFKRLNFYSKYSKRLSEKNIFCFKNERENYKTTKS